MYIIIFLGHSWLDLSMGVSLQIQTKQNKGIYLPRSLWGIVSNEYLNKNKNKNLWGIEHRDRHRRVDHLCNQDYDIHCPFDDSVLI